MALAKFDAPGRLGKLEPVAIVDIGSNSVRLVAYEGLSRAPTPIYNDKAMCGLGRGVATTGKLNEEGVAQAIAALKRFRVLCEAMRINEVYGVATAAARDARNGPDFLAAAQNALGVPIELLAGKRESQLAALGVICGFDRPDGVVGDLGGGSLELNEVSDDEAGRGVSMRIGGLSLMDITSNSPKAAAKIVRDALEDVPWLEKLKGRTFYAVGGTWRSLARLHMRQRNYPLDVMHNYVIPARDAADFAGLVERVDAEALVSIDAVSSSRRPLLAYGAVVLEEIIRIGKPRDIAISALGLREGLMYERLENGARKRDPLIEGARDFNVLRSRAPRHGDELCDWTDAFMATTGLDETRDERRLRHAACLLADISWRAHPDYRGEQSMNVVANAAFVGIDHPGRAFLALAISYRHSGEADVGATLRTLASARILDRAHILGAAMRVAYAVSAAMPDMLPRAPLICRKNKVTLSLPPDLAPLVNKSVQNRLKALARLIGREPVIAAA